MRLRSPVPLALFALSACSSTPPPQPIAPPAASSAEVVAPPPPPPVDLSPAPEPANLVGTLRWRGPVAEIDAMLRLAKAGFTLSDLAKKESKGEGFELLKQDGSVDVAVALDPASTLDDPKLNFALSIPMTSLEDALARERKKGHAIEQVRPGVFRVTKDDTCDLAVAVDAPARMVCGNNLRAIESLRPFLTRTLALSPAEPGLRASIRMKALRDRFVPELRHEAAKLEDELVQKMKREGVSDPEILGALAAVLDDSFKLADDLDRVELTHQLDEGKRTIVESGSLVFASTHSWMAQYVVSPGKQAGPVPPMFFKLPRESVVASFAHGPDPQLLDGPTRLMRKIASEITTRAKLDPADADAVNRIVAAWPPAARVSVVAQGVPKTKLPKLGPKSRPAEIDRFAKEGLARLAGWSLVGVDVPVDAYGTLFKRLRDGYQRALSSLGKKAKSASDRKDLAKAPALRVVESPAGYPKGSIALDLVVRYPSELNDEVLAKRIKAPPAPAGKPKAKRVGNTEVTARLVATPDGATTWVGFSLDPTDLGRLITATVKGAADDTLLGAQDLQGLKRPMLTSGGFFRMPADLLDDLFDNAETVAEGADSKDLAGVRALFATLPNKGRTPLLFFGTTKVTAPASMSLSVEVQPGTLDDAAAIGGYLMGPGRHLLKSRAKP